MANLYVNRIKREAGRVDAFTIDNVPNLWKYEVLEKLNKLNLDGYGQPLSTK